jgi:hypothetical protein
MLYVSIFKNKKTISFGDYNHLNNVKNIYNKFKNENRENKIVKIGNKFYNCLKKSEKIIICVTEEIVDCTLCFEFMENLQSSNKLEDEIKKFNTRTDIFSECNKVTGIMVKTTNELEEIELKCELLEDQSQDFKTITVRPKKKFKCKLIILIIIVIFVIICVIVIVVVVIVLVINGIKNSES